jgi:hypothetical protein
MASVNITAKMKSYTEKFPFMRLSPHTVLNTCGWVGRGVTLLLSQAQKNINQNGINCYGREERDRDDRRVYFYFLHTSKANTKK